MFTKFFARQSHLCRKSCHEISIKYRSGRRVSIFEIARMYVFTRALKKIFFTKVTNESTECISRALYKLYVQRAKQLSRHQFLVLFLLLISVLGRFSSISTLGSRD